MPFVESDDLLHRFGGLLGASTKVDIAVAWTRSGPAVERLLFHARRIRVRIAVGLSGTATEPNTLRRLMEAENVELRIASAPDGRLFHPKFYRFCGAQGTVCQIGSANFTRGGFGGNAELMHEFRDREDASGQWFTVLWEGLNEDLESEIARYEVWYAPPSRRVIQGDLRPAGGSLPRLVDIETWGEFVDALLVLDDYCHRQQFGWDVLGETHSYLHTMRLGGEIARRENWDNFSLRGCNILLGLEHRDRDGPGVQGLLGNMRAAGKAVGAFNPPGEPEVRSRVLNQIKNVVAAEDAAIVEAAQSAVGEIRKSPRFGPAVATRRLALACPHRLVSVNSKSVPGLGVFPRMTPKKDYLARNYCALL